MLRSFTMYDSIVLSAIPANATAVAGYVGGHWPTYPELAKKFPKAKRLSIAVNAEENAETLDVEAGDARIDQAPAWVRRQLARGVKRPVVYTSVSQAAELLGVLHAAGIPRSAIRLWTAHYTGKAHRCSAACGFRMNTTADATQYWDKALGRTLDVSLCAGDFLGGSPIVPLKVRRARLRAQILAKRARGATWASLKTSALWKAWRRLGGH